MPPLKTAQQLQMEQQDRFDKLKTDYEVVFSTEAGKRVLSDITLSCGVIKEIFSSDPLIMSYKEGRRSVGIHIAEMAMANPVSLKKPAPAFRG